MTHWTSTLGVALVVLSCAVHETIRVSSAGGLSRRAPTLELALGAAPSEFAVVDLAIGSVRNPVSEPVDLELALRQPDSAQAIPLGRVSLFPNDQPARFVMRATKQLQALGWRAKDYLLRLTLIHPDLDEPSQVALDDIRAVWRKLD